jgi:hypothetical protein
MRRQGSRREEATMTGKFVLITMLAAGCAAAVPVAHDAMGGSHAALHGGAHASCEGAAHGPQAVHARLDGALDALGLAPQSRARAKAIVESHFEEAFALHEKVRSGEIGPDEARAAHDAILASARSELSSVLSADQIRQLEEALHPKGAAKQ